MLNKKSQTKKRENLIKDFLFFIIYIYLYI